MSNQPLKKLSLTSIASSEVNLNVWILTYGVLVRQDCRTYVGDILLKLLLVADRDEGELGAFVFGTEFDFYVVSALGSTEEFFGSGGAEGLLA